MASKDGYKMVARFTGRSLDTIRGRVEASALEAAEYGDAVKTSLGHELYVLKPTLYDVLPRLRHATQVIYPIDADFITLVAGIGPGCVVGEAGTGSGHLTALMAWRVGPQGLVYTFEKRPNFAEVAWHNIKALGLDDRVELSVQDVAASGFGAEDLDAVVLDMGDPWNAVDAALEALRPGGSLVIFSTTVEHAQKSAAALRARGLLGVDMVELSHRRWKTAPGEMRPETRGEVFTGFIIWAKSPGRGGLGKGGR